MIPSVTAFIMAQQPKSRSAIEHVAHGCQTVGHRCQTVGHRCQTVGHRCQTVGHRHRCATIWCTARLSVVVAIIMLSFSSQFAYAFVNNQLQSVGLLKPQITTFCRYQSSVILRQYSNDNPPESEDLPDQSDDGSLNKEVKRQAEKIMLEKERDRLEEENFLKRLKSKPRKLSYEQARTWVQANLGVDTEAEFNDLVANGNLRTPYIPKNPKEYYTKTRDWISWDHFLGGIFDDKAPSSIRPQTGIFD